MNVKNVFKLSTISIGLLSVWQTANAGTIEHTCESNIHCGYSLLSTTMDVDKAEEYWIFSAKDGALINEIDNKYIKLGSTKDNLLATLKPQHYQNEPVKVDKYHSVALIGISGQERENSAKLVIPTGTTATLKDDKNIQSIVNIYNATAVIEKGVKLTIELDDQESRSDNSFSPPRALAVSGKLSNVTTSADIILNASDSTAIDINNDAKLFATNHFITLNSVEASGIDVASGGEAIVNNVTITGNKENQFGLSSIDGGSSLVFTNSAILLNHTDTYGISFEGGKVTLNNSSLEADIGVVASAFKYDNTGHRNLLNINNSTVKGRQHLLAINPAPDNGENKIDPLTTHSTTVNVENSTLYGKIITLEKDGELVEYVPDGFRNGVSLTLKKSNWTLNGDSQVDEILAVLDSNINFEKTNTFSTLKLNDLIGSANFTMNTDLANQKSDQIVIDGLSEGNHKLIIKDSGNEPQSANGKATLVKTIGNGDAIFALKDRDYVDAGAYRYRLVKESNDWVLSNKSSEKAQKTETPKPVTPVTPAEPTKPVVPITPTEPAKPVAPVTPTEPAKPAVPATPTEPAKPVAPVTPIEPTKPAIPNDQIVLSEKSNALVSLRQAQLLHLEQGLVGVHQRLGELKQGVGGNLWVRNLNSRTEMSATRTASNSQSSGFEQRYYALQVGADKAISDNLRLGGFVGSDRSSVEFKGEYGSGKLAGQSIGLYGIYQMENGLYFDNIAKFSRLKSTSNSTRRYNAYTFSSEIGKIYNLANQWSVTPNAQLAWSHISGKNDEDRLSSIYARLGVRVAKVIDANSWKLQPYVEVNSVTVNNKTSKVAVNRYRFDIASSRGRVETAVGINANTGNHRFGVEAKTTQGKRVDQPFVLQANYRYQW